MFVRRFVVVLLAVCLLASMVFGGTVTMFIFSTFASGVYGTIGAGVGLGIKGIAAALNFMNGQEVSRYDQTIKEEHHWQLKSIQSMWIDPDASRKSVSDLIFLGLDPTAGKSCGLTKVILKGTLQTTYWIIPEQGFPSHLDYPIGDVEIALCIPWFIWP